MDKSLDFADLVLANSLKNNRSLVIMENIDKAINWSRVESILLSHYTVGTSAEGADAYPPLLLFKGKLNKNGNPKKFNRDPESLKFFKALATQDWWAFFNYFHLIRHGKEMPVNAYREDLSTLPIFYAE